MPPPCRFSKADILSAAMALTREAGLPAVTARAIAGKLHASSTVIFAHFPSMDALHGAVIDEAKACYDRALAAGLSDPAYPPYKGCGMAYIRFAEEEKELFKLLFMRDQSQHPVIPSDPPAPVIDAICKGTGLPRDIASRLHQMMWLFVHGLASAAATSFMILDTEAVSSLLNDCYQSYLNFFCGKDVHYGSHPD